MAKRRAAIRAFILCLAGVVSGCSWIESIKTVFQDDPMPMAARIIPADIPVTAPEFRVGDVFHFRVDGMPVTETVEKIDENGVWWRDSQGQRRIGYAPTLMPTRPVVDNGGTLKIVDVAVEATGDLFPLIPGKEVAYRHNMPNGDNPTETHKQSCKVVEQSPAQIPAGVFNTYRLDCIYIGARRTNYYAPAVGRVVLQVTDSLLSSVKRELVSFQRGPEEAPRVAETVPARDSKSFGVQLAAYRSPDLAKRAWRRLRDVGGTLLAGTEPTYERREVDGKPLFRIIVGQYSSKDKARAQCQVLKQNGIDCWPRAREQASSGVAVIKQSADSQIVQR